MAEKVLVELVDFIGNTMVFVDQLSQTANGHTIGVAILLFAFLMFLLWLMAK